MLTLNYKGSDRVLIHQGNKVRGPNLPRIKIHGFYPENFSTLLQRGLLVDMTSRRRPTSNQRWKNVAYLNVVIKNVKQCRIIVAYFNVDVNNVRQCRNSDVLFKVKFYNVGQRANNVVKITIAKMNKKNHFKLIHWIQSFNCYFIILFTLLLILRAICWRILAKSQKLRSWKNLCCKNLI